MKVKLIGYSKPMQGVSATEIPAMAAGVCVGKGASLSGLKTAVASGHDSVLEHVSFTFRVEGISRVTLAQLTRHRIASFSVESQRYVNQLDTRVVLPPSIAQCEDEKAVILFKTVDEACKHAYDYLVAIGIPQEDARYILPEGMQTNLIVTMNVRELRHFFTLRCCNRAQWEIRTLADCMLTICTSVAPELFRDAGAPCMTGKPCQEVKPCGHPRGKKGE